VRQFVAASQGDVDRPFWQSLYKYRDESGGPIITGWISTLFPYLIDSQTGLATNRNPYLTLDLQRAKDPDDAFDDELDDNDIDDEIHDIDLDEEDSDDFDDLDEDSESPPAEQPPNRLVLRHKQNIEDSIRADLDPREASDHESPTEDEPPRQFIWITADDIEVRVTADDIEVLYDPHSDLDEDFDEDYHDERVVGAWLRPMPKRRRDEEYNDADFGWGPRISDLPSGISRAPFHWDCLDRSFDMEFLGGFVGLSQDKDTLTVKPEIGWAVREAPKRI
jgi:hypothetical protein